MENKKVGAVILAAGYSSRMGTFKAGLQLGDRTVISGLIASFKEAGIEDIIIVSGHYRDELLKLTKGLGVRESYNENYSSGMFSSIQAGVRKTDPSWKGFFLIPVDCPLIEKDVLESLLAVSDEESFAVPLYRGKKGHPLYIPSKYREEILSHTGEGGLKGITEKYEASFIKVETGKESTVIDMDTEEDYEEVKAFIKRGMKTEKLSELAGGRKFFLIRHGQIRQHREKIFLGQTDVPLSELGIKQAKKIGSEIHPDKVYSSDLKRAVETAERITDNVIPVKGFREMHLGDWDGRYMSEIREKFPEDYERRGRDVFSFKKGNRGENFFDLQYRSIKALKKILKEDDSGEIYIVAHSGVIRCIENNLKGLDVTAEWKRPENGEIRIIEL